ncbi:MAG: tetratricopeptide repeat protein [Candidatus Omnitrophota bacterium]
MKSFGTIFFTMSKVFGAYIQWFLFPFNIHPTLPDDPRLISYSVFEPMVLLSALAVLALIFIAVKVRKKRIYFSFGVFWFFITLIPVSSILFPLTNYMAARYLYLPVAGLCFLTAAFFLHLSDIKVVSPPARIFKTASGHIVIVLLIFYALLTVKGNMNFKDNFVFWTQMADKYPNNALAHSNLAFILRKEGLLDKAIIEYKVALNLNDKYANDHNALGVCYYEKGMFDEAAKEYDMALKIDPFLVSAYYNLGRIFDDKGSYREAMRCFEKAIQLDGQCLNAYNDLGITYAKTGEFDKAVKMWEKVLQIDPDHKEAKTNMEKIKRLVN